MTALITRSPSANAISRTTAGEFLELLPRIERHARLVFRALPPVEREEAVTEAVAAAFVAFRRLRARGLDPAHDFPSLIASYAALHVKDGRQVGSRRACLRISFQGSSMWASRCSRFNTLNRSGRISGPSSSQASGVDTVAPGRARAE